MSRRCGSGGNSHSFCAMYSLKMSVCRVPFRSDQIHAEYRHRRARDRHRRGDLLQRDTAEQDVHISGTVDRHAAVPDFAEGERIVGVTTHQSGHVEGHRKAARTITQYLLIALIGLLCVTEPGELADCPGAPAVTGGVHTTSKRVFAGPPDPLEFLDGVTLARPIQRVDLSPGQGGEVRFTQLSRRLRLGVTTPPAPSTGLRICVLGVVGRHAGLPCKRSDIQQ